MPPHVLVCVVFMHGCHEHIFGYIDTWQGHWVPCSSTSTGSFTKSGDRFMAIKSTILLSLPSHCIALELQCTMTTPISLYGFWRFEPMSYYLCSKHMYPLSQLPSSTAGVLHRFWGFNSGPHVWRQGFYPQDTSPASIARCLEAHYWVWGEGYSSKFTGFIVFFKFQLKNRKIIKIAPPQDDYKDWVLKVIKLNVPQVVVSQVIQNSMLLTV